MRPTTTSSYDPLDVIKSIWVINYWVIDVDTPVMAATQTIVKAANSAAAQNNEPPIDSSTNELEFGAAIDVADNYICRQQLL